LNHNFQMFNKALIKVPYSFGAFGFIAMKLATN